MAFTNSKKNKKRAEQSKKNGRKCKTKRSPGVRKQVLGHEKEYRRKRKNRYVKMEEKNERERNHTGVSTGIIYSGT